MRKYLVLIALGTLIATQGCKSSSTLSTTTKVSGGVVVTVDTGMYAWKAYVEHNIVPASEVDDVAKAYNIYYAAALADKAALEMAVSSTNATDLTTLNSSMTVAESSLLTLLNNYLPINK